MYLKSQYSERFRIVRSGFYQTLDKMVYIDLYSREFWYGRGNFSAKGNREGYGRIGLTSVRADFSLIKDDGKMMLCKNHMILIMTLFGAPQSKNTEVFFSSSRF